jgi:hypothetical protein
MQRVDSDPVRSGAGCLGEFFSPGVISFIANPNGIHGTHYYRFFIGEQHNPTSVQRCDDLPGRCIGDRCPQLWSDILIKGDNLQVARKQVLCETRGEQEK